MMKAMILLSIKSKISVLTLKWDFPNIGNKSFILSLFPKSKSKWHFPVYSENNISFVLLCSHTSLLYLESVTVENGNSDSWEKARIQ